MSVVSNNNIKCTLALAGLHNVIDPEIGLNIVDLGLVYGINFDEALKKVSCTMTLTTQFCPMGESITEAANASLQASFPGYDTDIELTFDPSWSYEMISDEGREYLNNR